MQVHDPSIAGVIIILNEIGIVDYYQPRANWHVHPSMYQNMSDKNSLSLF